VRFIKRHIVTRTREASSTCTMSPRTAGSRFPPTMSTTCTGTTTPRNVSRLVALKGFGKKKSRGVSHARDESPVASVRLAISIPKFSRRSALTTKTALVSLKPLSTPPFCSVSKTKPARSALFFRHSITYYSLPLFFFPFVPLLVLSSFS